MKKYINDIIIIALLALFAFIGAYSSEAKTYQAPVKELVEFTDTTTSHMYQLKDKTYPIFKTKKGRLYIWKISKKTKKPYKYYIPKEVEQLIKEEDKSLTKN